jgi:hypothetical protein
MFGFANTACEDQGSKPVLVEEPVIQRHEFEVWSLALVKKFDHPEAVFSVNS